MGQRVASSPSPLERSSGGSVSSTTSCTRISHTCSARRSPLREGLASVVTRAAPQPAETTRTRRSATREVRRPAGGIRTFDRPRRRSRARRPVRSNIPVFVSCGAGSASNRHPRPGAERASIARTPEGHVSLRVSDDGCGFLAAMARPTMVSVSSALKSAFECSVGRSE